jgi:hypothetical protein
VNNIEIYLICIGTRHIAKHTEQYRVGGKG